MATSSNTRYLAFDVCNGFANQRIAILTAALLAKRSGRVLVIPSYLGAEGEQLGSLKPKLPSEGFAVSFSAVYDTSAFKAACLAHRLLAVDQFDVVPSGNGMHTQVHPFQLAKSPSSFDHIQHVHVGCPILTAPAQLFLNLENVFWTLATTGLRPGVAIRDAVTKQRNRLGQNANVLHLRIEDDWVQFCKRWTQIADDVTRDNCLEVDGNTIASRLTALGVSTRAPLYVASHWARVPPAMWKAIRTDLTQAGYDVITSKCELPREMCAAVDYYSALSARQFVGNSVSTFSALLIMQRRHSGRYAAYYNGGTLPLAQWMPFFKLAWIVMSEPQDFETEASWIDNLKESVESGVSVGNVQPFVLISVGRKFAFRYTTEIEQLKAWLAYRGARLLVRTCHVRRQQTRMLHQASWIALATIVDADWKDIMQHNFALVSSDRMRYTARLDLLDFGSKLPLVAASGACDAKKIECAILANLAGMRQAFQASRRRPSKHDCLTMSALVLDRRQVYAATEHEVSQFVTFTP